MHRDKIQLCKDCLQCTKFGKNLKANTSFNSTKPLPLLSGPNEELQLDYKGPLPNSAGNNIKKLVATDRYSKYPSAMNTRSTGGKKIIKFLKTYIQHHSIPSSIKTDQYSGFKNKLVRAFCNDKKISQIFCPVGDHRGCGLVERSIQAIKRRLGASRLNPDFSNVHDTIRHFFEDIRVTIKSVTGFPPFELHFGRPPNAELSLAAERLSSRVNLDNQQLEPDLLTAEQRRDNVTADPGLNLSRKGNPAHQYRHILGDLQIQSQKIPTIEHWKALLSQPISD